MRVKRGKTQSDRLKGWQRISEFLGESLSVVQRWAHEGMPVHKEGKFVIASRDELNAWLGKQSGKPVRAATETTDLTKELKRGLAFVRGEKKPIAEVAPLPRP